MDQLPVIVLAGYSCAGKSILAAAINDRYRFVPLYQQLICKELAMANGYSLPRKWLAAVGDESFVLEIAIENARRIRALNNPPGVVLDASYGDVMHQVLRDNIPNADLIVISVRVETDYRTIVMMGRMNAERSDAEAERIFRDGFFQDVGLDNVMRYADFVVHNSQGTANAMAQVIHGFTLLGIK